MVYRYKKDIYPRHAREPARLSGPVGKSGVMSDGSVPDGDESPWRRTLEQLHAMADELEADGWETVRVPAAHVTPEPPAAGSSDRYGLVYVAPGEVQNAFTDLVERGSFTDYEVFRQEVAGDVFVITKLTDPDERLAILLAGGYDRRDALELRQAATESGTMYSHVQLLDWTHLGSFEHENPELFFPD